MHKPGIIIVEDEALIADHLAVCLEEEGYEVLGVAESAEEALALLDEKEAELCLLDINLEGDLDGVDLAHEINRHHRIPFIFITSNTSSRTLNRVKLTEPAGFIVKPYTPADIASNVAIALYKSRSTPLAAPKIDDSFFIREKHELIRVRFRDIRYVEAMDNYVRIHTVQGRHVLSQTLKSVERKLQPHHFIRVHRSFLINLLHIDLIAPRHVLLGETEIPVSESQRTRLLELVQVF